MRLHEFITTHRDEILPHRVIFARTCVPAANELDLAGLRDHAAAMLEVIVRDLQTDQTEPQRELKSLGFRDAVPTLHEDAYGGTAAQLHGAGRAERGFTIEQMVSEYRALRASVLKLWLAEGHSGDANETADLMRFNEAIDQALAESVTSFARVVEKALGEARERLEARVEQRTQQLSQLNSELLAQVRERERSEQVRIRLLQQVVRAQEDEQKRIARELHDQLGQDVTALSLKARALRDNGEHLSEECKQALVDFEKSIRQLDDDVEFLVWQLRPTALDDVGLGDAICDYADNWSKHSGVAVHIHMSGMDSDRLPGEVETVLYRVMQEALNNVAKHAHAKNIEIALKRERDEMLLTIADDGVGFDMDQQRRDGRKHFGLDGMNERAALVGGTVTVESRPGRGTTVSFRLPFASAITLHTDRS